MRIIRILLIIISILFIFFTSVFIFFQTPYGKNIIKNIIINKLEKSISAKMNISKLHGDFFKKIILEDVSFEKNIAKNQNVQSKLSRITIKFWFWKILRKKIEINEIELTSPEITYSLSSLSKTPTTKDKYNTLSSSSSPSYFSINIKKITIENGIFKANQKSNNILSAQFNGNFSLNYPGTSIKNCPDININSLDINIASLNQNILSGLNPSSELKKISFIGKAYLNIKGDLNQINMIGDIGLNEIAWEKYKINKSGIFINCQYKRDKILDIMNAGIDLNGNQLSFNGKFFLDKPEMEYELFLKLVNLNTNKDMPYFVHNTYLSSPFIFSIKGKGFKIENIDASGKCENNGIEIAHDLKVKNISAVYRFKPEGFYLDKGLISSNFGEGEITGKFENYRDIKFDFIISNFFTEKNIKLESGKNLEGTYSLRGNIAGQLDSSRLNAHLEVNNFRLDSTQINSLQGDMNWTQKNWGIDLKGYGLYYTNLYSKQIAVNIGSDTTYFDTSKLISDSGKKPIIFSFKFDENKFPKTSVSSINGKIHYFNNYLKFKSIRFKEKKNVALLSGNFYINSEKNTLDKDKDWELNIDVQNMNLEILKPFLPSEINRISGYSAGNLFIHGTPSAPLISGNFNITKAELDYPIILKKPLYIDLLRASINYSKQELIIKEILLRKGISEINTSGILPWNKEKRSIDTEGDITWKLRLKKFNLEELEPYLSTNIHSLKGEATLDLNVSGKISSPVYGGQLEIKTPDLILAKQMDRELKLNSIFCSFLYKDNKLNLNKMYFEKNKKILNLSGYLPLEYQNKKFSIIKEKDLSIKVTSVSFNLENFTFLIPSNIKELSCNSEIDLTLNGNIDDLNIIGKLMLDRGKFLLDSPGIEIKNFNSFLLFKKDKKVEIKKIASYINDNFFEISGEFGLRKEERILKLTSYKGTIRNVPFVNVNANTRIDLKDEKKIHIENFSMLMESTSKMFIDGTIYNKKDLNLKLDFVNVNLSPINKIFQLDYGLKGILNARNKIKGDIDNPVIDCDFMLSGGITKEILYEKISGKINLNSESINLNSLILQNKNEFFSLSGVLPLERSKDKISISTKNHTRLALKAKNFNLYFLPQFVKNINKSSSNLNFDLTIDGPLIDSKINGNIDIKYLTLNTKKTSENNTAFDEPKKMNVKQKNHENKISLENFKGEWTDNHIMILGTILKYNDYYLNVSGEGVWKEKEFNFNFLKVDGKYKQYRLVNLERFSGGIGTERAFLKDSKFMFADGEISAFGTYSWNGTYNMDIAIEKFDLRTLAYISGFNEDIKGKLNAQGSFSNSINNVSKIDINILVKDTKYSDQEIGDIVANITTPENNVIALSPLIIKGKTISRIEGRFPYPSKDKKDGKFFLKINLEDIDLKLLNAFTKNIKNFNGKIRTDFTVNGSFADMDMKGNISIKDGEFFLPAMKKKFTNINTNLNLDKNKVILNKAKALIGNGIIEANGTITLGGEAFQNLDLKVNVNDWLFLGLPDLEAKIDGEMTVQGNLKRIKVKGTFTSQEAKYTREFEEQSPVDSLINKKIEESSILTEYDLEIILPKNAWVKNKQINAEVNGHLFYRDNEKGSFLTGRLSVIRGEYNFEGGRRFNILVEPEYNSYLEFLPEESKVTPKFHFLGKYIGKYKGEDKIIELRVGGTIDKPEIVPTSPDGTLKESDIFPFITYGTIPSLDDDKTQQTNKPEYGAISLGLWGDRLLFQDVERRMEKEMGVDIFQFKTGVSDKGEYEFQAVKLGKYIAPNFFVVYSQPTVTSEAKKFEAQYQINKYFFINTEMDDKGTRNVDLKFRFRY